MQRYLPLVLLLFASIVFLVHPVPDLQGAQSLIASKTDKQEASTTTAKPGKKKAPAVASTVAVKTKTGQQPGRQQQRPAQAVVAGQPQAKPQQTVSRRAPVKRNAAPATTSPPQIGKHPPATPVPAKAKTATTSPQTAKVRNKEASRPAAARVAAPTPATALPEIDKQISSRSAIVMDAQTGEELFTKSPDNPRQPASTIKIVTAMIALKSLKNDEVIDVSDHAAGMPSSKIFLETSKHYRANDLINAVLLASANDASVALAEKIAGSEDNFANLMTLSARMWGARNTVCRTASGLTALGQQSTARDLANLFRYAMQHDEFARRMQEKFISTSYGKVLRNHNKALWRLDGAVGGKTGYTVAARQTYVGQFSRDNQTIVVAIMGSETMWADLAKLVEYGFRKKKEEQVARIGSDGAGRTTQVN